MRFQRRKPRDVRLARAPRNEKRPGLLAALCSGQSGRPAACTAVRHPETFGTVLSQAGAFWYNPSEDEFVPPDWLAGLFAHAPKLNLRFCMDAGLYELDFTGRGANILAPNRHLRDVLIAKGYEVHYQEFPGEHDPINGAAQSPTV
jgi:enterochelin esterase family protein